MKSKLRLTFEVIGGISLLVIIAGVILGENKRQRETNTRDYLKSELRELSLELNDKDRELERLNAHIEVLQRNLDKEMSRPNRDDLIVFPVANSPEGFEVGAFQDSKTGIIYWADRSRVLNPNLPAPTEARAVEIVH